MLICFKIKRGKHQGNFFRATYIHVPVKFVQFFFWIFLTSLTFATLVFNQLFAHVPPPPPKINSLVEREDLNECFLAKSKSR